MKGFRFVLMVVIAVVLCTASGAMASGIPQPLRIDVHPASSQVATPNHLFGVAGLAHKVTLEHNMLEGADWVVLNQRSHRVFDWGDGTSNTYGTGQSAFHTWQAPGVYTVKCRATMTAQDGGQTFDLQSTLGMANMIEKDSNGFVLSAGQSKSWSVNNGLIVGVLISDTVLSRPSTDDSVCLKVNGVPANNLCLDPSQGAVGIGSSFEFPYMSLTAVPEVTATLEGNGRLEVKKKTIVYFLPEGDGEVLPLFSKPKGPIVRLPR